MSLRLENEDNSAVTFNVSGEKFVLTGWGWCWLLELQSLKASFLMFTGEEEGRNIEVTDMEQKVLKVNFLS